MKCNHCQSEWNSSIVLNTCPFCGADLLPKAEEKPDSMQGVLKVIIRRDGVDALKDGRRTLAMFSDLAPDLRKEKTMFSYLLQCDGHAVLLDALTKARPQQIATRAVLIQRMTDELLLSEAIATQACDGFWAAIGGQAFETVSKSVPAPAPKPAPQPTPAPRPASAFQSMTFEEKCAALRTRIGDRMIACGYQFIAALDVKGRVRVTGSSAYKVKDAEQWQNIIAICAGFSDLVGLKADGTVCSAGYSTYGQGNVGNWTGVVDIAAGYNFTIGLKADGTVVYTGDSKYRDGISRWKNIISIAAGDNHAVGLKADGTAVAVGENHLEQCEVSDWDQIAQIIAGATCTYGIRQDGTAVSTSRLSFCKSWPDLAHLSCDGFSEAGLTRSGKVFLLGETNQTAAKRITQRKDLLTIYTSMYFTLGLTADGSLIYASGDYYDLEDWKLFDSPDQLDAWLTAAEESKKRLMARI